MRPLRFALLVQRRLSARDLPLLVVLTLLTAAALLSAIGPPRLLAATLDRAARQAVEAEGSRSDVVVGTGVGITSIAGGPVLVDPAQVGDRGRALRARLPASVRRITDPAVASALGPEVRFTFRDTRPQLQNGPIGVRIALLTRPDAVRLRSGALPATTDRPGTTDVVVSQAVATATSLRVGSVLDVPREEGLQRGTTLRLRVTGIVDRVPVTGPSPWSDTGPVWSAQENRNGTAPPLEVVALTDAIGAAHASNAQGPFTALFRMRVVPSRLTATSASKVAGTVTALRSNPAPLQGGSGDTVTVRSSLPGAVAQAERQARSATAQFALLTAGVLGTAGIAIVLLGGLIAARRRDETLLQRARGTAVPAIAAPALVESAVVVLIAGAVAAAVLRAPISSGAVAIAVVALLAVPLQLARSALGSVVRRAPANRSDRVRLGRMRAARRIAAEAGLVLIAVVAVLVLNAGGGLSGSRPNPLLLVAPLLLAAAATVVVLRVLPPVVTAAALLVRRSRGVPGVLVAARARRTRSGLALLAVCVAFGLALNDGMLVAAVDAGQEEASWDRVGADARASTAADADPLRSAPGVRHASSLAELRGTSVDLTTTSAIVTVLAVDRGYPAVAASLPYSAPDTAATFRRLRAPGRVLPVVVDADLARSMAGRTLQLQLDSGVVPARAVGVVPDGPSGYLTGPYVFVDLDALTARVPTLRPTTTLVIGPGAGPALRRAGVPSGDVITRTGWLAAQRARPLVTGTRSATLLAAGLLGLFALAALSAGVLAGSPDRRRTLGLLRTLGMRRRIGWWLLVADLAPLVLGGLAGGAVIGVVAAEVFDPVLVLAALTGGRFTPPVVISGPVLAAVLGGAAVVLALTVAVEAFTWRRDRFTEVLRVGGQG